MHTSLLSDREKIIKRMARKSVELWRLLAKGNHPAGKVKEFRNYISRYHNRELGRGAAIDDIEFKNCMTGKFLEITSIW